MGTLYDCLREARLEKYFPAFRANGITRSESLAHLTIPEFCAMGISGAEDIRRLVELVNIIKSVHRGENRSSNAIPRKRQPGSPIQGSTRQTAGAAGATGSSSSQSDKKVPRRHPRSPAEGAVGGPNTSGMRLEPTRDVSVRERGPNFCATSYIDMLGDMSNSSHSDSAEHLTGSFDSDNGSLTGRVAAVPAPVPVISQKLPRKTATPVERVKQQSRGYNYGVPSSREVTRSKVKQSGRFKDEKIRVCVRKRPLSRRESRASDPDIVEAGSTTSLVVKEPKVAVDLTAFTMKHEFMFDEVFDESSTNEDVYIRAARPLIGTAFQKCNATFFAYGQTGAGKTHTMIGGNSVPGLYQLAAKDVFDIIESGQHGTDLHVWVSFFEIYCGQLFDLLNRRNRLIAREDGSHKVCIAGLTETEVPDVSTLIQVLEFGNSVRSRGTSGVNPDSSRSHAVLQLEIRDAHEAKLGKISFIDLAGSERAADMGDPDRQTRMEGAEINQSLLALKECIRSIDQESRHTPFRQSKLTHILKDAFVGNSRTCMIANLSPSQSACEHTLNTLRYADRVKELKKDSGQSGAGGPSFGQAMNLLMNIPLTAPSIFNPSNVLSTSTPIRPRVIRHLPAPTHSAAADVTFDPSETPIRGHLVQLKPEPKVTKSKPVASSDSGGGGLSTRQRFRLRTGRNTEAAASQGVFPAHPEASPSESDQTDTDSNNVTHPTETRPAPSQPNLPVIRSTDTEFDFPTSDFNNIDDHHNVDDHLNDLNQGRNDLSRAQKPAGSEGKGQRKVTDVKGQAKDQASAAAAGSPRSESPKSSRAGRASSGSSSSGGQASRRKPHSSSHSHRHPSTPPPDAKQSKNSQNMAERFPVAQPPASNNNSSKDAGRSAVGGMYDMSGTGRAKPSVPVPFTDNFDDELLFADSGPPESLGFPQAGGVPKVNKHLMNVIPAVQTACSSDLTSFSQRSPLRNGLDKTPPSDSPCRDSLLSRPSTHNNSASPHHYGETAPNIRGVSKEPASTARTQLPSAGATAVRDWVSQTGDRELSQDQGDGKRNLAWPGPGPGAGSAAENYLRNQLSARERQTLKTNFEAAARSGGDAVSARADSLSGPSSDPVLSNRSTPVSQGSRDSISLPSQPQQQMSARHNANSDFHTGSDSNSSVPSGLLFSVKTTASTALVTEKLLSGAVFSPIHPQPVSTASTRTSSYGFASRESSSKIVHPTPVTGTPSDSESSSTMSPRFSAAERDQARISLVGSHEDQLASITMLCKQEMKLLLNAKKAAPRSFEDYMNRVSSVLAQKMSAIQLLQDEIRDYRVRFSTQNPPSAQSSAVASVSDVDRSSVPHM